jgi:hypothetical protein
MSKKISDFVIVTKALQILCKRLDCDFIDLPVVFDEDTPRPCFKDGTIVIPNMPSVLDTMVSIYSVYVNSLGAICGRNLDNLDSRFVLMKYFISMLRDFKTEYGGKPEGDTSKHIQMKLDQFHVTWMLLKNIFCPYKSLELKNVRVVAGHSPEFDAVVPSEHSDGTPFLFVNLDIEKSSVRSAFLLVEALRIMVKPEDSPEAIIREMLSNFFMKDRIVDFLSVALGNEEEVASFLGVLSVICQSKDIEQMALGVKKKDSLKTAQMSSMMGNFWFLGLTEKMLESVRGSDWSTTETLKDFSKDLWDKVEEERRARGLSELPFELLLRVQSKDLVVSPDETMQELLSKTRVW